MELILLGTAAGGGFPQWNCWCPACRIARADPAHAHPRTQSSVAISADGRRWFLLNASPDVRGQLETLGNGTATALRHTPVEGIVVTDAELDHTLGITLLREGRQLQLYATRAVQQVLEQDSRILPVTAAFTAVSVTPLELNLPEKLRYLDGSDAGLEVTAFEVAGGAPRFAREARPGHTVGLRIRDTRTGATAGYLPGCGALDPAIEARLAGLDLVLFDGTFWTDDEMILLGLSDRTARQMDHLPVSGPDGSLERIRRLACRRKVYVHINNSNPMLVENSAERRQVEAAGVVVGDDGMRFTI